MAAQPINALKLEYLDVGANGALVVDGVDRFPCNGLSGGNIEVAKLAATNVLVTLAGGGAEVSALLNSPAARTTAVNEIVQFVSANELNGVDVDLEPGLWTAPTWSNYLGFLRSLVAQLTPIGDRVEADVQPWLAPTRTGADYAPVAATGATVVVMAYDNEYNSPCAPIAPYAWLRRVVAHAMSEVPSSRLVIGLPAYGYVARGCRSTSQVTTNVAFTRMRHVTRFPSSSTAMAADRDRASGELRWRVGGALYDVVDATALRTKESFVISLGVRAVSVWSLGGEPWFDANP